MFEDMQKKFEQRRKEIESAFEEIGDETAKIFINEAKSRTERKKLVDTGNYKRSWRAQVNKKGLKTEIDCINEAEYASHLEYGHRIVTRTGKDTGRKTQAQLVGRDSVKKTLNEVQPVVKDIIGGILKK